MTEITAGFRHSQSVDHYAILMNPVAEQFHIGCKHRFSTQLYQAQTGEMVGPLQTSDQEPKQAGHRLENRYGLLVQPPDQGLQPTGTKIKWQHAGSVQKGTEQGRQ